MTRLVAALGMAVCLAVSVAGQDPQSTVRIGTRVGMPESGYQEVGRRDPFAPLVAPPSAARPAATLESRAAGLAGQAVADVELKGVVASGATRLALFAAADGKTYMARVKDRLHDAVVLRIDADAVVLRTTPGAQGGAREVLKQIRPAAGGGHP